MMMMQGLRCGGGWRPWAWAWAWGWVTACLGTMCLSTLPRWASAAAYEGLTGGISTGVITPRAVSSSPPSSLSSPASSSSSSSPPPPGLLDRYRVAGFRLAPDPMLWSHVGLGDWLAEDVHLPWCAQVIRTLEIDGPKLLALLNVDVPYGASLAGSLKGATTATTTATARATATATAGPGSAGSTAAGASGTAVPSDTLATGLQKGRKGGVDPAQLVAFLERHDGGSIEFDHGMGVRGVRLPQRRGADLRESIPSQASKIADRIAQVIARCVSGEFRAVCPSAEAYPPFRALRTEGSDKKLLVDGQPINRLRDAPERLPVMGSQSLMKSQGRFGTCAGPVQPSGLLFSSSAKLATRICCHNRHYAEQSGYFKTTTWPADIMSPIPTVSGQELSAHESSLSVREPRSATAPLDYFDSITGKLLFSAPRNRTVQDFYRESVAHGWPSFRDSEVEWQNVRSLPNGEIVSIDGTHLGHNIPDQQGNRYCINLVCIAGKSAAIALDRRGAKAALAMRPGSSPTGPGSSPTAVATRNVGLVNDRVRGMLWGLFTGNALGMPTMWFYQPPEQIVQAFGPSGVRGFESPPTTHPGSVMRDFWRSDRENVRAVVGKVILHGRETKWQTQGTHYHSGLRAGDNTLNARLVEVLMRTLSETASGDRQHNVDAPAAADSEPATSTGASFYDADAYLESYVKFMTTPGTHDDTYADTAHIQFFYRYSKGMSPRQCAGVENHSTGNIGSTVALPVILAAGLLAGRWGDSGTTLSVDEATYAAAERAVLEHVALTHQSSRLQVYLRVMCRLFARLLSGVALRTALRIAGADLGIDFDELLATSNDLQRRAVQRQRGARRSLSGVGAFVDLPVVVQAFGLACYIHDALPTTLYLAFKYHEPAQAATGLLANANIGGNTADRGAILGALFGAVREAPCVAVVCECCLRVGVAA